MIQAGEIATIGYEGSKVEDFIAVLRNMGIEVLYDVRELPSSRKKGFSKRSLSDALDRVGIEYVHSRPLGDPKEGREAARAGEYEKFKNIFQNHMGHEASQAALKELVEIAREKRTCLMCYERDPKQCHRHIVVDEILASHHFKVRHLGVPVGFSNQIM